MQDRLFLLIDTNTKEFYNQYSEQLQIIHKELLKKLEKERIVIVGTIDSNIADFKFQDMNSLFEYINQKFSNNDIIILDAYAGLLSMSDMEDMFSYLQENLYDICFAENLPKGILPIIISKDFINDFLFFLKENQSIISSFEDIIDWEFQGIDVGVYLSSSLVVMRRIDFLPINKGAIEYILQIINEEDVSIKNLEQIIKKYPNMLRNYPSYIAIELSSINDGFKIPQLHNLSDMTLECFQKIINEIKTFAPESMISLGIWGEPLTNELFRKFFELLNDINNKILVESRGLILDKELCELILMRPNTELIFDISFSTETDYRKNKKISHSIHDITKFINSFTNKEHIWIRLTRSHETEEHIKLFFKQWQDFMPRIIITKEDSFGKIENKVVDLAPIQRHACLGLRREMVILNDGTVLLCRQNTSLEYALGNILDQSLEELWQKNMNNFLQQENGRFKTCSLCEQCDDWWIWN